MRVNNEAFNTKNFKEKKFYRHVTDDAQVPGY